MRVLKETDSARFVANRHNTSSFRGKVIRLKFSQNISNFFIPGCCNYDVLMVPGRIFSKALSREIKVETGVPGWVLDLALHLEPILETFASVNEIKHQQYGYLTQGYVET